ncbi:MAG: FG-GAP-like repeat-containing protein, partial [Bacteroidota bacterium]
GDFNGDGIDDISWNLVTSGLNRTYTALLRDGTHQYAPVISRTGGWGPYTASMANINNDGRADMVYSELNNNRTYISLGQADGSLRSVGSWDHSRTDIDWNRFELILMDIDGDQQDEILWLAQNYSGALIYAMAEYNPNQNDMTFSPLYQRGSTIDANFTVGDINGDQLEELVLLNIDGSFGSSILVSNAPGLLTLDRENIDFGFNRTNQREQLRTGKLDRDDNMDVLLSFYPIMNNKRLLSFMLGKGNAGNNIDWDLNEIITVPGDIVYSPWIESLVMDVNQDGVDDLVWVKLISSLELEVIVGVNEL